MVEGMSGRRAERGKIGSGKGNRAGGRRMAAKASAKLMRVLKSDDASFAEDWQGICDRRVDSVLDVEKDVAKIIAEVIEDRES